MKILVTGGTGVIGAGVVPELLSRGHHVRLLSRHADDDAKQWNDVESFSGNVADAQSLSGAADGCDAILHIVGIAAETPPDLTFEKINVDGTRHLLDEASRAGVKRFVYVSSLGADTGESAYHQSKLAAERAVEASGLDWRVVRPGNVYGPGDEVISTMLKMVRALPVVPVIDDGNQEFQPIWYEDLAKVLAAAVERDDLRERTLEAAGRDITSMNDIIQRFASITDRMVLRVPVPTSLAQLAAKLAPNALNLPIDDEKLTMLREKNVVRGENAIDTLNVTATPLDAALRKLADAVPEVLPEDGFGSMEHKHFWADIRGTQRNAVALMSIFRERINEIMPIDFAAEPDAPERIEKGATMTGNIPMRGNIQVRVEVVEPTHVVLATIEGHPLAGIVEFTSNDLPDGVRFSVDVHARASNIFDWIGMKTFGRPAQNSNWRHVVQRMIDASGGTSDGVHEEKRSLDDDEATRWEEKIKGMVQARQRAESPSAEDAPQR
ncbi:MAG TPA: NAD-dependent epimerase/dehydratase family protein [Thermoanaerobaculia bacterium]